VLPLSSAAETTAPKGFSSLHHKIRLDKAFSASVTIGLQKLSHFTVLGTEKTNKLLVQRQ
jgi:ABC-type uncharacterized transport system substrate-binding protein